MDELKIVLEENPRAKEEFGRIAEMLSVGTKEALEYIERLEEMIVEGACREEMLQTIDYYNCYTERMQYEGILEEDETWWEGIVKGEGR